MRTGKRTLRIRIRNLWTKSVGAGVQRAEKSRKIAMKRGFGRALKALGVKNMQVRFVFTEVKVILQKI
ncbi:hypothetical protein [Bacteroides heparinolyticus]|uniref:Uncharacterized protein n=1 Tax=Prevotella heparinolytica TaxID=28113 RepID=A0A3P2A1K7_9BACE|nr:hypothetical protein [Bacteroides heparinolyticus]RRD88766.1 hypothetical protein EII33_11430 [Bacteroides heparinolyticus]